MIRDTLFKQWRSHKELALVYCITLVLTVGLQWRNRAFDAEFTSISDESAHYVTGLMLHDYILHGWPENPMSYATRYYEHYPRVALGHWPPVFYLIQAGWSIPFGVSRESLIFLMAVISGSLLTTTYAVSTRYFPRWLCWSVIALLASSNSFQSLSSAVMSEILVALLAFWSILMFEHYLHAPGWQSATGFALLASATILTKATGVALVPTVFLAAVANNVPKLDRRKSLWLAPAVVAIICGPWFLLIPGALHERVAKFGGVAFQQYRPLETVVYFARELSLGGLVLAVIGIAVVFARYAVPKTSLTTGTADNLFWSLAMFFFLSTVALRTFIGAWERRHVVMLLPFFTLFFGMGLKWIIDVGFPAVRPAVIVSILTIAYLCVFNTSQVAPKQSLGLAKVAEDIVRDSRFQNARLLIVSDSVGEGVFVAEVAMHELRPGHFVERGSKIFATDGFMGDEYKLRYQTPSDLMSFLEKQPAQLVIVDAPNNPPPHLKIVRQTITEYAKRWNLIGSYSRRTALQDGPLIQVYTLAH